MEKEKKLVCVRNGFRFEWHGGEYINIFKYGEKYPFETIGVWDSNKNAATIPFTRAALRIEAGEWILNS